LGAIGFLGALIVAIVVGLVIGGGTGTTIVAITGAMLALTLFVAGGGIGLAANDLFARRGRNVGRSLDEEEREREKLSD
jgi:hypothetical protein